MSRTSLAGAAIALTNGPVVVSGDLSPSIDLLLLISSIKLFPVFCQLKISNIPFKTSNLLHHSGILLGSSMGFSSGSSLVLDSVPLLR